jgi:hypothetical protein
MLIFDRFPSRLRAEEFALDVAEKFYLKAYLYDSQDTMHEDFERQLAQAAAGKEVEQTSTLFPFELTPPIVLVERPQHHHVSTLAQEHGLKVVANGPPDYDLQSQDEIEACVCRYGGTFAGT